MWSKGYKVWVVLLLAGGNFINALDRSSMATALPLMQQEFTLDAAQMGIILSAFFWPYLLFNIPAGYMADRFGAKKLLGWAAALWSVASGCTGFITSQAGLLAARIGVGVGEAASQPTNAKVVADNFSSSERGTVIGFYLSAMRIGYAATPVLMAFLMAHFGWRMAFFITGFGSLIWCIIWFASFREKRKIVAIEGEVSKKMTATVKVPWGELLKKRTTIGIVLMKFCQDYTMFLFLTWIPSYLVMERGFSIIKMGIFASLPWMAGAIVTPLVGYFSDVLIRRGMSITASRKIFQIGLQVGAACILGVNLIDDPYIAIALLTFVVAAESAAGSMAWTILTEIAPKGMTGAMGGLMNTSSSIAGILAPIITGYIVKTTHNFYWAFVLGGVMLLIAAFMVLVVIKDIKPIELTTKKEENLYASQ